MVTALYGVDLEHIVLDDNFVVVCGSETNGVGR
jgi:hypothetical protein